MRILTLTALLTTLATPVWAAEDLVPQFQKMADEFAVAFAKGDTATMTAQYAPDATVLPNAGTMVKGHDNIEKMWKGAVPTLTNLKVTVKEVLPIGKDAAREIGTITARTKGENPQDISGKYVVLWIRQGGEWKNNTDIWNLDK